MSSIVARVLTGVAMLAVAVSAIHRFRFAGNTFFIDEIWVVEAMRDGRFWAGLPQPPLFFFTGVAASRLCGLGEVCLRLPALSFALLLTLVPLAALRWTRGVLDAPGAAVWTILLAFSSPIVFYAARVKQYPAEAFGAAAILASFLAVAARPESGARRRTYFVVCAVLVTLLHAMPFVILGTGVALTWLAWRSGRAFALRVLAGHAALGVLFAAVYVAWVRPTAATTAKFGDLYDYFSGFPVYFDGTPRFVVNASAHWIGHMLNLTPWLLYAVALLLAAWIVWMVRRREPARIAIAVAGLLPIVAVLCASAFETYPYGEVRLMIFAAPGLFLLVALAAQDLARVTWIVPVAFGVFLAVFVLREIRLQPYNTSYIGASSPKATYAFLRAHHRPGIPIVSRYTNAVPLAYYLPAHGKDVVTVADDAPRVELPPGPEVWALLRAAERPDGAEVLHRDGSLLLCRIRRR